jgi:hypothetical protein
MLPKMPNLFTGAIALEYGDLTRSMNTGHKSTDNTCGDGCTAPGVGPKGDNSCPAIPKEKEPKPPYPKKKAFTPTVAGWVEPPVAHM